MRKSTIQQRLRRNLLRGVALSSFYLAMVVLTQAADSPECPDGQNLSLTAQEVQALEEELHQLQQGGEEPNLHIFPNESFYSDFLRQESTEGYQKENKEASEVIKESLALSIDGGGIRGLMPAKWLAALEEELLEDHKVQLYRVFDYIGGTSIGGILSLGLAHGIRAADLVPLFEDEEHRRSIFPKARSRLRILRGIKNTLHNTLHYFTNRYDSTPLENLLRAQFEEHATIDALRTNVLVTACTVEGSPFLFERGTRSRQGDQSYRIWEVARSTSAAPTYFEAYQLEKGVNLVDGGLWVNNPSILVAGRMIKKWGTPNIGLLSLGTGIVPLAPIPINAGKFAAIRPVLDILMDSHSVGNHLAMEQFLGDGNYVRVNPRLDMPIDLDATDERSIAHLAQRAQGHNYRILEDFYAENRETIRHILEKGGSHAE